MNRIVLLLLFNVFSVFCRDDFLVKLQAFSKLQFLPMLSPHPSFLLFCLQALHQNLENLKPKMRGSKIDRKGREAPVTFTVRESSGSKQVHTLPPCCLLFSFWGKTDTRLRLEPTERLICFTRQIWLPVCEKNPQLGPTMASKLGFRLQPGWPCMFSQEIQNLGPVFGAQNQAAFGTHLGSIII